MRIGIDLSVLAHKPWTGVAKYAWNLARALLELKTNHEFVFFVPAGISKSVILNLIQDPECKGVDSDFRQNDMHFRIVELPQKRIPFWTAHVTYARIMKEAGLDVLHGVANVLPWFYPSRPARLQPTLPSCLAGRQAGGEGNEVVITIHDLAIYKHPEWFPKGQHFSTKFLVPRSIKKADAIVVPSETTKQDLLEFFRVGEEKIHIVPLGVGKEYFKISNGFSPPSLQKKYILFVGTLEPRKNLARLIQAYQSLFREILKDHDLVIAGVKGWGGKNQISNFKNQKLGNLGNIRFLGYVPDEDLPALYQNASLFVYPSLYEGFGLPVLEGLAAGVPVVTSKNTAMAELVTSPALGRARGTLSHLGEGGGEATCCVATVDPYSVNEIRDAMIRIIRDDAYLSQKLIEGQKLARSYTWERTARATLEVYLRTEERRNGRTKKREN